MDISATINEKGTRQIIDQDDLKLFHLKLFLNQRTLRFAYAVAGKSLISYYLGEVEK
jgi:hypothetical protein